MTFISERDLAVPMRDGVLLRADVYRTPDDVPRPALLALSPYGKGKQTLGAMGSQPGGSPLWDGGVEAGDPGYLTDHGYVHVIADARGSGHSEGLYRGWMAKQDGEDGHDLVEWIAAQPWCDGNVGMVGISAFGTVQLHAAAEQPPHLKAIMPWNAPADFYREATHHGGIVQTFFQDLYARSMRGRAVSVVAEQESDEAFRARLEEASADPDLRMYTTLWNMVDNPESNPSFHDVLLNPLDGPFYRERSANSRYDRIQIPVYARSAWWAYAHMHLVGTFEHFTGIPGLCKIRVDEPVDEERPLGEDYNAEVVRWYDHWLKGERTGIADEPPITLFLQGSGETRHEHEWPLARTEWTTLFLCPDGSLGSDPPAEATRELLQRPLVETREIERLRYLTPPLAAPLELTGPFALTLHAALDQPDANWIVVLVDVAPDGTERELTRGYLKASHRAVDEARSEPWLPFHPHDEAVPVVPGEVVEYRIAISPTANVFPADHRLALDLTMLDHRGDPRPPPGVSPVHMPWHICSSATTRATIHHGNGARSSLLVPVIAERGHPWAS